MRVWVMALIFLVFLTIAPQAGASRGQGRCRLADPKVLSLDPGETVTALAMSRAGDLLAAGTDRGRLLIWDLPSGTRRFEASGPRRIEALTISPNENFLAAASARPGLRIWRLKPRPQEVVLSSPPRDVMAVAFSTDGSLLAFGGRDRTVGLYRIRKATDPVRLGLRLRGHTSWVSALAFSPDNRSLYSGSWDDRIRAFDLSSGKLLWESRVHKFAIETLVATASGLAASSDDGRLSFHRYGDGRVTRLYKPGAVVAMGRIGRIIAGVTWEGKLLFLDSRNARLRCAPRISKSRHTTTWSLALSQKKFAVGDDHGTISIYPIPLYWFGGNVTVAIRKHTSSPRAASPAAFPGSSARTTFRNKAPVNVVFVMRPASRLAGDACAAAHGPTPVCGLALP